MIDESIRIRTKYLSGGLLSLSSIGRWSNPLFFSIRRRGCFPSITNPNFEGIGEFGNRSPIYQPRAEINDMGSLEPMVYRRGPQGTQGPLGENPGEPRQMGGIPREPNFHGRAPMDTQATHRVP